MSMGIGTNAQNPDEGELTRKLEQIACGVWFTSTGRTIPQMFKYQDGERWAHRSPWSLGPFPSVSPASCTSVYAYCGDGPPA